ncbi:MAG: RNA-binding protein [Legionellales bacterium]|nr:RNA-binding protein [Legionellales bacterium]
MSKTKIYVGSLSYDATQDDLENHFKQFGNIKEINLIHDRETGRSKGFAFIEFDSQVSAEAALKSNNQELLGRNMRVNIAEDRRRR